MVPDRHDLHPKPGADDLRGRAAANIVWSDSSVARYERTLLNGHRGATLWLTGLPASGKSTIGGLLERALVDRGIRAYRVDGDNLRHGLNAGLSFSAADRAENVRRAGEACLLLADAGVLAIACLVSPYRRDRELLRERHAASATPFFEVFVYVPPSVAESRDPKGLYQRARAGTLTGFTGVDDPYEAPQEPDLRLDAASERPAQSVERLIALLVERGILAATDGDPEAASLRARDPR